MTEEQKQEHGGSDNDKEHEAQGGTGDKTVQSKENPAMPSSTRLGADGKPSGYSGLPGGTGDNQGDPKGNPD